MRNISKYPKTTNIKKWVDYLGRKLDIIEYELLESLKSELLLNRMLSKLYLNLNDINKNEIKKLYIPLLTEANGNCLFESLVYNKIGEDIKSLRISLGYFMYQLQNIKLPGSVNTLKESFKTFFSDDIQYIYCKGSIYEYSYNIMCKDICNDRSWTRLPTNLILLVISWIFKAKIIIISDNTKYKNIINAYENIEENNLELRNIYLGKLGGEYHYVPIDILDKNEDIVELKHDKIKGIFYEWAEEVSKEIN